MNVAELQTEVFKADIKSLWVFAYGSLCWRPGFEFNKAVIGSVKGYQRRFWQGNISHRGTEQQPGRVATLIEDKQGEVPGVAFAISGEAAIPYLSQRECKLGGYISHFITFYPMNGEPFKVLTYIAFPNNPQWLGHADAPTIAKQVLHCRGNSGSNVEYILRLANFMREHFSHEVDLHLYDIEKELLTLIQSHRLCLNTLMGNGEGCVSFIRKQVNNSSSAEQSEEDKSGEAFQFTSRIQGTKLRCLNL